MRRRDAHPDGARYHDKGCPGGCEQSLTCPYEVCVLEVKQPQRSNESLREAALRLLDRGDTVPVIAAELGVSRRHIYRVLSGD